jgi:hypothetical protein
VKSKYKKKAKSKLESGKHKHKIGEIQRIKKQLFCLDFPSLLNFAVLKFGFPRMFRKSVKSKQKICFLLFGFHRFYNRISRIFRRFCLDFTGFELFGSTIQIKTVFCLDFLDFCLDFTYRSFLFNTFSSKKGFIL